MPMPSMPLSWKIMGFDRAVNGAFDFRMVCVGIVILVHVLLAGQEGAGAYLAALWTTQTHVPVLLSALLSP